MSGEVTREYGSWGENVGSWLAASRNSRKFQDGNFLLVRYEDMIADPEAELFRVARFLGIAPTPERIASAVARSSAEQMRKLERSQGHMWSSTRKTRQDKPFVRAAKAGNWTTELPDACAREIESAWGTLMKELGYELRFEKAGELERNFHDDLKAQMHS